MRRLGWLVFATACGSYPETPITPGPGPTVDGSVTGSVDAAFDVSADSQQVPWSPPGMIAAQRIYQSDVLVATPPAWNANLSKMVSDGNVLYAVHHSEAEDFDSRRSVILHRAVSGDAWVLDSTEATTFKALHQPPGLAMDRKKQLHMVFNCVGAVVPRSCYTGGVGSQSSILRFYHLIFAPGTSGTRDFTSYLNYNEFSGENHGYMGIEVLEDDRVVWSFMNADDTARNFLWWQNGTFGSFADLPAPAARHMNLYPIALQPPAATGYDLWVFTGEFNAGTGGNAAYESAMLHGRPSGGGALELVDRHVSGTPISVDYPVGAFPSDMAKASDGATYAIVYERPGASGAACVDNVFMRIGGTRPTPKVERLPIRGAGRCLGSYLKMQITPSGRIFLFAANGRSLDIAVSGDRGTSWVWHTVPMAIANVSPLDVTFGGYTLLKPETSPLGYDPRKAVLYFSGQRAVQKCAKATARPLADAQCTPDTCYPCAPSDSSYFASIPLE